MSEIVSRSKISKRDLSKLAGKIFVARDVLCLQPASANLTIAIHPIDLPFDNGHASFAEELASTIFDYVSDASDIKEFVKRHRQGRTESAAWFYALQHAKKYFRRSSINGQFSELLLYCVLQMYFDAVPVIRKMPITTNPNLERNGADAIHVTHRNGAHVVIAGEAKTYSTATRAMKKAISDGAAMLRALRKDIALHIDIPGRASPEAVDVVRDFLDGNSMDTRAELVCLATYDVKKSSLDDLVSTARALNKSQALMRELQRHADIADRFSYVVFPVSDLPALVRQFQRASGLEPSS